MAKKTEQEWLEIYHEVWNLLPKGHNRVRLKIGQFDIDDTWACIEVLSADKELLKKIFNIADKYKLRCDFQGQYEFKLWEEYEENKSEGGETSANADPTGHLICVKEEFQK